jgi:hypothetical protein
MIDKQEQRARAAQLSAENAAKGLVAPKLDWPVPKKVVAPPGYIMSPPKYPMDVAGNAIHVGDKVVCTYYNMGALIVGEVIGFSKSKKSVMVRGNRYGGSTIREFYKPIGKVAVI